MEMLNETVQKLAHSKFAYLAVAFLVLFALERLSPLRRRRESGFERLWRNVFLAILSFAAVKGLMFVLASKFQVYPHIVTYKYIEPHVGVLKRFRLEGIALFIGGLLLYDLTYYYWHIALHRVPLLWRFHNIHHIDPDMDVSTALRFHPVELLFGFAFTTVQLGVIGLGGWALNSAYLAFHVCMLFHHSNFRLPYWVERIVGHIVVTPRTHGIHHSVVKKETNSNYAVVFRFWDFFHGTLKLNVPQNTIDIGVAGYKAPQDNTIEPLIFLPFAQQRDYWRLPDGDWPDHDFVAQKNPHIMMP